MSKSLQVSIRLVETLSAISWLQLLELPTRYQYLSAFWWESKLGQVYMSASMDSNAQSFWRLSQSQNHHSCRGSSNVILSAARTVYTFKSLLAPSCDNHEWHEAEINLTRIPCCEDTACDFLSSAGLPATYEWQPYLNVTLTMLSAQAQPANFYSRWHKISFRWSTQSPVRDVIASAIMAASSMTVGSECPSELLPCDTEDSCFGLVNKFWRHSPGPEMHFHTSDVYWLRTIDKFLGQLWRLFQRAACHILPNERGHNSVAEISMAISRHPDSVKPILIGY